MKRLAFSYTLSINVEVSEYLGDLFSAGTYLKSRLVLLHGLAIRFYPECNGSRHSELHDSFVHFHDCAKVHVQIRVFNQNSFPRARYLDDD